ncbi:MAG TPA: 7TM diverse intracellular signaling domain-containing protein [Spirochaetota bacterium]|nr:7TM diverse intracellular signaling domain-containing protein [Spirochaetota bacterium]HPI90496.1 7TM diverse intracellular signaling domain-containing protein [Spirochaetota bacterium]HPR46940.1 7TM diverse intracellular signaling domain-containing protein [Spirochaetota bacterium]
MLKILFAIIILQGLSPSSLPAAPPLIINEHTEKYSLDRHIDILEDKEQKWDIRDIASDVNVSRMFVPNKEHNLNLGYSDSVYWIRFQVDFGNAPDRQWLLEAYYPLLDRVELYIPDGRGSYTLKKAGRLLPFAEREIKHRKIVFPLPAGPEAKKVFHVRVKTEEATVLSFNIISSREFYRLDHVQQFIFGLFYGIMLIMALYNLFLFFFVRDRSYLYYVLYIISVVFFLLIDNGFAYEYLWPDSPWWGQRSHVFFLGIATLFVTAFVRNFVDTKFYTPKLDKIFPFVTGFSSSILFIAFFADYTTGHIAAISWGTLCVIFWMTVAVLAWKRGSRSGGYFIIAWTLFLVFGIISSIQAVMHLTLTFFTLYGMQVGAALETVLLSLGLANRINILREEKELAQAKASEQREKLIKERMRISRDIHDSIGSELTGIILELESSTHRTKIPDHEKTSDTRTQKRNYIVPVANRVRITLEKLRDIVYLLNQSDDVDSRIGEEMLAYLERLKSTGKYSVKSRIDTASTGFDIEKSLHIQRIFLEWMTNLIRHSGAKAVDIRWYKKGDNYYLVIIDDGRGFDWRPDVEWEGSGLRNISSRVDALGADARSLRRKKGGSVFLLIVSRL